MMGFAMFSDGVVMHRAAIMVSSLLLIGCATTHQPSPLTNGWPVSDVHDEQKFTKGFVAALIPIGDQKDEPRRNRRWKWARKTLDRFHSKRAGTDSTDKRYGRSALLADLRDKSLLWFEVLPGQTQCDDTIWITYRFWDFLLFVQLFHPACPKIHAPKPPRELRHADEPVIWDDHTVVWVTPDW